MRTASSLVPEVRASQILDGMVTALEPMKKPAGALHVVQRYMGEHFAIAEAGKRGISGRTPAVLPAFAGEKPYRRTIGGRVARVEGSFLLWCVSDSWRSMDDRQLLLDIMTDVRDELSSSKLGLAIQPLQYAGSGPSIDDETMTAYSIRFTTRYVADFTVDPGADLMLSAAGQVVAPCDPPGAPTAPLLTVNGGAGVGQYAYDLQALFAGPSSDFSPWASTNAGPAVLGGGHSITVSWPAVTGAVGYLLRRRWSPDGGPASGVIYAGTATSFVDDGSVAGDGNIAPARGTSYSGAFQ